MNFVKQTYVSISTIILLCISVNLASQCQGQTVTVTVITPRTIRCQPAPVCDRQSAKVVTVVMPITWYQSATVIERQCLSTPVVVAPAPVCVTEPVVVVEQPMPTQYFEPITVPVLLEQVRITTVRTDTIRRIRPIGNIPMRTVKGLISRKRGGIMVLGTIVLRVPHKKRHDTSPKFANCHNRWQGCHFLGINLIRREDRRVRRYLDRRNRHSRNNDRIHNNNRDLPTEEVLVEVVVDSHTAQPTVPKFNKPRSSS